MKYDLIIHGGTIVNSKDKKRADLAVRDGSICEVFLGDIPQSLGAQNIDARGLYILPGIIDGHVHFRDPGLTHKEDFSTGSKSALYGGITYAIDMPNVNPVTSTADRLRERIARAKVECAIDMGFFALLTDDNLDEMEAMRDAGAVGFKIYLGTSVGNIAAPSDGVMLEQFRRAAKLNMRIGFHAENNAINDYYTSLERARGENSMDALVRARPDFSEVEAVCKAICFARETGARIHIFHVSSAKTVDIIRMAKREGIDITAETCPQYLLLNVDDCAALGPLAKVFPTIKTERDRRELWNGIHDGTIDMVATDHAPHAMNEKKGGVWTAMAGAAGVEISLRLMLNEVNQGNISLEKLCELMSEAPARIWNLEGRGRIAPGMPANLTIVDLDRQDVISNARQHGKSNNTLFDGRKTQGAPVVTVVHGAPHWIAGD